MRLDHIAYRVADRNKTADFFIKVFGYTIAEEFPIQFEDETWAKCLVLVPPEKIDDEFQSFTHSFYPHKGFWESQEKGHIEHKYHLAPEIFISDGSSGSIVKDWVNQRGGIGGIHHLAYQVDSVEDKVKEMKELGFFEFTTTEPIKCEGLTQIFTKPSELTGVIYEFIKRDKQGFCKDSVKDLMNSTKDLSINISSDKIEITSNEKFDNVKVEPLMNTLNQIIKSIEENNLGSAGSPVNSDDEPF